MAAGVVADADRHAGQVLRTPVGRTGGHEDAGLADGVGPPPHFAVRRRRGSVDRPVTGRGHITGPPGRHVLEGAAAGRERGLVAALHRRARGATSEALGLERVVEPLLPEVTLLLGDPLLQAHVRLDPERHVDLLDARLAGQVALRLVVPQFRHHAMNGSPAAPHKTMPPVRCGDGRVVMVAAGDARGVVDAAPATGRTGAGDAQWLLIEPSHFLGSETGGLRRRWQAGRCDLQR